MLVILQKRLNINSKYYTKILSILRSTGHSSKLVGGCVRDAFINKLSADIDIATTLLPEKVIDILSQHEIKLFNSGIEYGTVGVVYKSEIFQITTLRKDISTDGRRAEVRFTDDFEQDAIRRDFSINALYYCPFEESIYDYCGGIQDLERQKLVFIGDPISRIKEDYLRILRFFRFSCYYSDSLSEKDLKSCVELKDGLNILSKERIKDEMDKLIAFSKAPEILSKMFEFKILQIIFPIISTDSSRFLANAIRFSDELKIELMKTTRYAILFYGIINLKVQKLLDLKFSKLESDEILSIHNFLDKVKYDKDYAVKEIYYSKSNYLQYILVAVGISYIGGKEVQEFLQKYIAPPPIFPLRGNDIVGIKSGAELGLELKRLKEIWIRRNFSLTKKQLLNHLK